MRETATLQRRRGCEPRADRNGWRRSLGAEGGVARDRNPPGEAWMRTESGPKWRSPVPRRRRRGLRETATLQGRHGCEPRADRNGGRRSLGAEGRGCERPQPSRGGVDASRGRIEMEGAGPSALFARRRRQFSPYASFFLMPAEENGKTSFHDRNRRSDSSRRASG
jgi:hypothetical protein